MKKDNKKTNIQKDILKTVAEKTVIPINSIKSKDFKKNYAIARTIKNLVRLGCIQIHSSGNQEYIQITPKGKQKINCLKLTGNDTLVPAWDGLWRIIILNIPENRRKEREALRYLLKKANFSCIKNTVWISPLPYENLFTNIKKDFKLSTEMIILTTNKIDPETNSIFLKAIKN